AGNHPRPRPHVHHGFARYGHRGPPPGRRQAERASPCCPRAVSCRSQVGMVGVTPGGGGEGGGGTPVGGVGMLWREVSPRVVLAMRPPWNRQIALLRHPEEQCPLCTVHLRTAYTRSA